MALRAVICKDDPTSHGGVVLEGNPKADVNGRLIAQKGHMTHCPQCKGDFPIVEGVAGHTLAGIGTAIEGMKTACGATLIATTTKGFMMIDDELMHASATSSATAAAAAVAAASASQVSAPNAGCFRAIDQDTGKPIPDMRYRIELPDGSVRRGVTNANGYTERVSGHDPATVKLHWDSDA